MLTQGQAYEVTKLLEGVITQGTGAGYTSIGCSSEAGKTGTSEGESDAWFVGYTPLYSTAVWVGHPQSREATGFGGPTAGPIWRSFMESAADGNCPEFPVPSSLPELSGLHSDHTSSCLRGVADHRNRNDGANQDQQDDAKQESGSPKSHPEPLANPSSIAGSHSDPQSRTRADTVGRRGRRRRRAQPALTQGPTSSIR